MMRAYELMVIIDGDIEDTAAQARVKSISDAIVKAGGTIHGKPDWWGRRQYAYPINKKEYGYYVVYQLLAPVEPSTTSSGRSASPTTSSATSSSAFPIPRLRRGLTEPAA